MEKIITSKAKTANTIFACLCVVIGILVLLIIIGTIIGLTRNSDTPLIGSGNSNTSQNTRVSFEEGDIRVFSGLGRLRIPLVNNSVLILSIAFPYQANDIPFTEELAGKINEFKSIASEYFSSLPENKITQIDEESAKTEILSRFNSSLRLGKISTLYFNDMIVLDAN